MQQILSHIIENKELHARWLNTLSFMENAGARKISACEHSTRVGIIQLKHAAEEHRHAYYLKKQIQKLEVDGCSSYQPEELLAAIATQQYLHLLDIRCCRYLKQQFQITGEALKYAAYLFVTYAIEVRADELYPHYQTALNNLQSKVMVRSIIVEEEGHLEEMMAQLQQFHPQWETYAKEVCALEAALYQNWLEAIHQEVNSYVQSAATVI